MQDNIFGKNLRDNRKFYCLTQQQLADRLHLNRKVISNWELGKAEPGLDDLKALAKFFDMTVDELLNL